MTVEQALPKVTKILLQAQEEMKEKKQELELSYISESSGFKHKVLDVKTIATLIICLVFFFFLTQITPTRFLY